MIKIEVTDAPLEQRNIPGNSERQPFTLYEQTVWAHLGGRYPEKVKLAFRDPKDAYTAGEYQPDPTSFYVGKFDKLMFSLRLKPLNKNAAKVA